MAVTNPVLYLPFEDTVLDYSGTGNNGTLSGATYVKGRQGQGLYFDGVNDSVRVDDHSTLDMEEEITIRLWANRASNLGTHENICAKNWTDRLYVFGSANNIRGALIDADSNVVYLNDSGTMLLDRWYHIVMTYTTTDHIARLYVNNVEVDTETGLGTTLQVNANDFIIGNLTEGGTVIPFNGDIDEVLVDNRCWSPKEVSDDYNQGLARYSVVVQGVPANTRLMPDGFQVHPNATTQMSWAEIYCKHRFYERGDSVLIYMNYDLAFDGTIKRERQDEFQWTAIAYDKLSRWRDEPCITPGYYKFDNYLAGSILVELLGTYLPGEFDTTNVDAGGTITHIDGYGMYVYDYAQELARRANYDVWLEPPNKVYFKAQGTVSTGATILYGTDILDIICERDDLDKRDQIIVEGRRFASATAGTGDAKHLHVDEDILTDAQAQEVADALLTKKNVTLVTGNVTLKNYRPEIRSGQTLVLDAPRWGFGSETVRATQVTHSPIGTSFTLGDDWSTPHQIADMEGSTRRVKEYTLEDQLLKTNVLQFIGEAGPGCSDPGYQTYQSRNGGSVLVRKNYWRLGNNLDGLYAVYGYPIVPMSHPPITMKALVQVSSGTVGVGDYITIGKYVGSNPVLFGFHFVGGSVETKLYGINNDGGVASYYSHLLGSYSVDTDYELDAVFDGSKIKWYVNSVEKASTTVGLPSGAIEEVYMRVSDLTAYQVAHTFTVKNFTVKYEW